VHQMGPSVHESIDMLLAANGMEVHEDDAIKKKARELGTHSHTPEPVSWLTLLFTVQVRPGREQKMRKPKLYTTIHCRPWNL
jgi:hypothetical protein